MSIPILVTTLVLSLYKSQHHFVPENLVALRQVSSKFLVGIGGAYRNSASDYRSGAVNLYG